MNENFIKAQIVEKHNVSHDTMFIKLKSSVPLTVLEISFFVFITNDNFDLQRPYTPISQINDELSFVIKVYKKNGISEYISKKNVGDFLHITQPIGKLKYDASLQNTLMICGGTGITPMLQILKHEQNTSKFTIISCNKSYRDILINRDIINKNIKIFHVLGAKSETLHDDSKHYFVAENHENVIFSKVNTEVLQKIIKNQPIKKFDFVYVCGPPGFMEVVSGDKMPDKTQGKLQGVLYKLGYTQDIVYKF